MMLAGCMSSGDLVGGRYEVLHHMHQGGMCHLYKVRHLLSGESMVLKCLASRFARDATMRRRLQREGEILARLKSAHVVRAIDFGSHEDGSPFLVIEYLDGQDLGKLLAEGRLTVLRSVELIAQACAGITAVHLAGVLHRDITPSNLFVCRTLEGAEWVKVLDLGIAKVAEGSLLTMRKSVLGTLNYIAPEQLRDAESLDARADVYALAAVLYHCLSGVPPFTADSPHRLMQEILYGRCTPLWERSANVPGELAGVVHRALSRERTDRPDSVEAFHHLLLPFRPHRAGSSLPATLSSQAPSTVAPGSWGLDRQRVPDSAAFPPHSLIGPDTVPTATSRGHLANASEHGALSRRAPANTASVPQVLSHPLTWLLVSLAVGFGFSIALLLEWYSGQTMLGADHQPGTKERPSTRQSPSSR